MVIRTLSWSLKLCYGDHLYECIAAILRFAGLRVVHVWTASQVGELCTPAMP